MPINIGEQINLGRTYKQRKKSSSEYIGVCYLNKPRSGKHWQCQLNVSTKGVVGQNKMIRSYHDTEREAAIAYDTESIKIGRDPVNILKRA